MKFILIDKYPNLILFSLVEMFKPDRFWVVPFLIEAKRVELFWYLLLTYL